MIQDVEFRWYKISDGFPKLQVRKSWKYYRGFPFWGDWDDVPVVTAPTE